nr:hypothetical protein [Tanacetum cinerariifolium]
MAASAIAISFDSLKESVGSPASRVIFFSDIPTVIPSISMVAPETSTTAPVISFIAPVIETTIVASPTGLSTSPFLYTDSPEASDSSDGPPSQDPYAITEAIPLGRPYHTHPNGPRRVMIARKRVEPLPAHRLTWRHVSPRSSDHHPSSSSSPLDSSPVYSSGLDAPCQSHFGSLTRVVSPRLGYPPVRAPRHSEAFLRWCAALLSTFYPPTTLESSSGDSSERPLHSSSHSAGPSHKRCRSSADYVPSPTLVTGSLAPTLADLLPRRKRELDIVDEDNVKDHIEVDPRDDREEFEASVGDTAVLGIDPRSVPMVDEEIIEPVGGDSFSSSGTRDGTNGEKL